MSEHVDENAKATFLVVSDATFDRLRFVSDILLPAIAALYFGLAQIWELPKAEEVVGTIALVTTAAGALLRALRSSYKSSEARFDGSISIAPGDDPDTSTLNVSLDPEAMAEKDEVLVKVRRQ